MRQPKSKDLVNNKAINKNRTNGFTLAEVLVTIGIIGMIANMTIPTLMASVQDSQHKASWKKSYSAIANATNRVISENGGSFKDLVTNGDDSLRLIYEPYLSVSVQCPQDTTQIGKCWHAIANWKLLNNGSITATMAGENYFTSNTASVVLSDGTLVKYMAYANCNYGGADNCGYILFDVNGFKKPNTVGKDIYAIHLTSKKAFPFGTSDGNENSCTTSSDGFGCSAQYLMN